MKKKICFAISGITDNGVTRVVSILLDEIDYSRYDVSVLLTRKVARKRSLNPRARIVEVPKDLRKGITGKISNILDIRKILKRERFELIVALGDYAAMYTMLACSGMKAKKIVSERNDPNREPGKKAFRKLRDMIYRHVDTIVCQTSDAAAYFEKIVKNRIIIHNPITPGLPTTEGVEREKRIVNFCRIDGQKNLPLLVDAFRDFVQTHPDYTLDIYGNGPDSEKIRKYITDKNMSEQIHLHGFCLDIHEKIRSAAMFVSSSDFEGMSNSMLESMAIGLPTICTNCPIGGAHEVIESGVNGILVPVGNKEALVQAMEKVADNPLLAQKLSFHGRKIKQSLSAENIIGQWQHLIEASLTENRGE